MALEEKLEELHLDEGGEFSAGGAGFEAGAGAGDFGLGGEAGAGGASFGVEGGDNEGTVGYGTSVMGSSGGAFETTTTTTTSSVGFPSVPSNP